MRIRPYQPADRSEVLDLWRACGLVVHSNDPVIDLERKITVDPEGILVGTVGERIVGTVMLGYEGHRGWINYLAVAERFRHQGLGRRMMEVAEERLAARGCPKINLQVRESNHEATAFYERIDYRCEARVSFGKRIVTDGDHDHPES